MRTWTHDQIHLLFLAAKDLREDQKAYLADRNQETGARVGTLTAGLDRALGNLMRGDSGEAYPHPEEALHLVEACLGMRAAQHRHIAEGVFSAEAGKAAGAQVGLAAERLDDAIADILEAREATQELVAAITEVFEAQDSSDPSF